MICNQCAAVVKGEIFPAIPPGYLRYNKCDRCGLQWFDYTGLKVSLCQTAYDVLKAFDATEIRQAEDTVANDWGVFIKIDEDGVTMSSKKGHNHSSIGYPFEPDELVWIAQELLEEDDM